MNKNLDKVAQSQYELLMEERIAFQNAGMELKVKEWTHKIAVCEASMKYSLTSFEKLVEELGVRGLNDVLKQRLEYFNVKRAEAISIAYDVMDKVLNNKKAISESKLWSVISDNDFRFVCNPLAKVEALRLCLPKLKSKTLKSILEVSIKDAQKHCDIVEIPDNLQAYIKIVEIENYKANDNPGFEVLQQISQAKEANLFNTMFVAYPMIGRIKQIDPIVFGVVRNPFIEYKSLSYINKIFLNGDAPVEYLKKFDFGVMFKITEWV